MIITRDVGVAVRLVAEELVEKFGFAAVVIVAWDGKNEVVTGTHAPNAQVVANLCAHVTNQINAGEATVLYARDEKPRGSS